MSYNDVNYEWTKKGGTLSDKTAFEEFGLTQNDIMKAINEGNLQFREGSIYGNPYFRLLRSEVEKLASEIFGKDLFNKKKALLIIMGRFMSKERLPPIHPGEILLEEFLKPLGLSQYRLAKEINVPARRINEIVLGKRAISPDTALRLSRYFGLSERFWMNLQARYDLEVEKDRLQDRLEKEVLVYTATA